MVFETLIEDYLGCRANKRRSPDSVHFELHWERDLARLLEDFNGRTLVSFLYAFINPEPRPREVIACLMQMKILQRHFEEALLPALQQGSGVPRGEDQVRQDIRERQVRPELPEKDTHVEPHGADVHAGALPVKRQQLSRAHEASGRLRHHPRPRGRGESGVAEILPL